MNKKIKIGSIQSKPEQSTQVVKGVIWKVLLLSEDDIISLA